MEIFRMARCLASVDDVAASVAMAGNVPTRLSASAVPINTLVPFFARMVVPRSHPNSFDMDTAHRVWRRDQRSASAKDRRGSRIRRSSLSRWARWVERISVFEKFANEGLADVEAQVSYGVVIQSTVLEALADAQAARPAPCQSRQVAVL